MTSEEGSYGRTPASQPRAGSYASRDFDGGDDGEFTSVSKAEDSSPESGGPPRELIGDWLPGVDGEFIERGMGRLREFLPPDDAGAAFGAAARFDTGYSTRELFGHDNRTRVRTVDDAPYRYICYLYIDTGREPIVGTGWLAGPRTIITAGHCVHRRGSGWVSSVTAYFGQDGTRDSPSFKITETRNIYTVNEWKDHKDPRADIGAIVLDTPVGDTLGYFGFADQADDELLRSRLNIVGYPAEFPMTMYEHGNLPNSVDTDVIYYTIDTTPGNSGSPVIVASGDRYTVVGIHNNGPAGNINFNRATRINKKILAQLRTWKNA